VPHKAIACEQRDIGQIALTISGHPGTGLPRGLSVSAGAGAKLLAVRGAITDAATAANGRYEPKLDRIGIVAVSFSVGAKSN
jgi:hypothetical protein